VFVPAARVQLSNALAQVATTSDGREPVGDTVQVRARRLSWA
jgi:hypothetical protein